jgi:hypothetical protein
MTMSAAGSARQTQAQELVSRWLSEDIPNRLFGFGGKLVPLAPDGLLDNATLQDATSVSAAIEQVAQSFGSELGAVVVVSDGHETTNPLDTSRLRALGVKVHTVNVGAREDRNDDAIIAVEAPVVAFVHQEGRVRVAVRAPGRSGQSIQVVLRRGDEVVRDGIVTIGPEGTGEVDVVLSPERVGRELYRVSIPVGAADPLPSNNERAFVVRVARDRTRVLLVSGRPSWDARFLRGLLNSDPAVDLITFFILRTPHDLPMASPEEMSLIPWCRSPSAR